MTEERYAEIFNETLTTMDILGLKTIGEVAAYSKGIYALDPSDTHTSVLLRDTKVDEEQKEPAKKDFLLIEGNCQYCGRLMNQGGCWCEEYKASKASEEQNIMDACQHADNVLEYLVKHGLVGEEMLFHGKDVDSDDELDPTNFTPEGRDLFEFIYNIVRTTWEESQ